MAKKKEEGILMRGIYIAPDTVYEVGAKKPGEGAPDVYKKIGSEKASSPTGSIANIVGFPFVNGLWDTGLYPTSPIFSEMGLTQQEAEIQTKANIAFVVEPLKKAGLNRLAEQLMEYENEESEFFNGLQIPLFIGNQFNTGQARDRLALYAAVISGELAPQGKANKEDRVKGVMNESDYVYNDAQYTIESKTNTRTVLERREYNNNKARGLFFMLLQNNKADLTSIMSYEGIPASKSDDEYSLSQAITRYFQSNENIESFLDTYERYKENDQFKEELKIMNILLNERGLRYLEKSGREYLLKGVELGTDVKTVARNIAGDKEVTKNFLSLIKIE